MLTTLVTPQRIGIDYNIPTMQRESPEILCQKVICQLSLAMYCFVFLKHAFGNGDEHTLLQ